MTGRRHAYITPDELSGTTAIKMVVVPVELLPAFGGALGELMELYRWEQIDGISADAAAQECIKMIDTIYEPIFVGMISAFAFQAPGNGWLPLAGQDLEKNDYPELWSRVPPSWKSGTTITLPNMQDRFLTGASFSLAPLGSQGGETATTLTTAQIPSHTHTYTPPSLNPDSEGPGVPDIGATVIGPGATTGAAGGGEPHDNRPKYLAVTWAIFTGRDL